MSVISEEGGNNILQQCLANLEDCAGLVAEYLSDDEREDQLNIIERVAREYHEQNMKHKVSKVALRLTEEYFDREKDVATDVEEKFNENVKNSATHVTQFEEDPVMQKIRNTLNNARNIASTSQNADHSIVVTQVSQLPIDPITKTQIQDPCRNKVCGHTYEYSIIVRYIKSKKSKNLNCPYVGCANKNITISDLVQGDEMVSAIGTQGTGVLGTSIEEID